MDRKIPIFQDSCPHCGQKAFYANENLYYYGSPIRSCKKCKKQYLDKRYHEIAIEGYRPNALSVKTDVVLMMVFLCLAVLGIVLYVYERDFSPVVDGYRTFHTIWISLAIVCPFAVLYFLYDIIAIRCGWKQKILEKKRIESEQRLSDNAYAELLQSIGYDVPKRFL